MFRINHLLLGIFSLLCIKAGGQAVSSIPESGTLVVAFDNLYTAEGYIRLALYSSRETFMKEEYARLYSFRVERADGLEGVIRDLPYGEYAFAVFHDENSNDKLDTNLLGIPTEPYGFSKPSPSKWRLPTFDEAKFRIESSRQTLSVPLVKWKL